jgi:hypothetical protein
VGRTGAERLRRAGTPTTREGGRHGYRSPARAAREELVNGRRAMVGAGEVEDGAT